MNRQRSVRFSTRITYLLDITTEGGLIALLALETLSPATLVGAVGQGIVDLFGFVGQGLATAMPLVIVAGAALAFVWLRNRGKPDKVVNFQLGGGEQK